MLWVARLFEERYTVVRVTLVVLSGVGYLVLIQPADPRPLATTDWYTAVAIFAAGYVAIWSPFAYVLAASVALGIGDLLGSTNDVVPTVGLAWGVLELAMRRSGWQVWAGILGAVLGHVLEGSEEWLVAPHIAAYDTATSLWPILLWLYLRSLRELNRQAAQRTAQESARVRAEERTSIARELHDLVAHHVASIVLRVGVARNVLTVNDPRVREVLDDVHATASGALADLRRLVAVLREPGSARTPSLVDPAALAVALASAVERSRQIGLDVEATVDPDVVRLDARTALAVLRLTQEGLANVAKHAGPRARVRLSIQVTDGAVEYELRDYGGPAAARDAGDGHGLIGLRERVEALGGHLRTGPAGPGWHLSASMPQAVPA